VSVPQLGLFGLWRSYSAVTVSPSGPRKLFKGVTTATSGVLARFPWLLPVRNSFASYGATTPPACTKCDAGHNKSYFSTTGNTDKCSVCPQSTFQPSLGSLLCEPCKANEFHPLLAQTTVFALGHLGKLAN
jgi:hypothetical protein